MRSGKRTPIPQYRKLRRAALIGCSISVAAALLMASTAQAEVTDVAVGSAGVLLSLPAHEGPWRGINPLPTDRLRPHFLRREFGHPGNEAPIMDEHFLDCLERFRHLVGRPVIVTSGSRTPDYNRRCGGVPNSQHCHHRAADVVVRGRSPRSLVALARQAGFTGIGVYRKGHLHVDTRDGQTYWGR